MAFQKNKSVLTNLDKESFKRIVNILNSKDSAEKSKIVWHKGSQYLYAYETTFRFENKLFKFSETNEVVDSIIDTSAPFKKTYRADVDFLFNIND